MNTYSKYCPNVYLAKCDAPHEPGEIIPVTTHYGKENECLIHNLIFEKGGFFYYSITRADGYDMQARAAAKAERYTKWAASADRKSEAYRLASEEGREFLSLGEPIKVGHHSEKRHRALIDRNWNRMGKSVEQGRKAEVHEGKAADWQARTEDINLSMPESVAHYEAKLAEATQRHAGLKAGTIPREHSYSFTYANKAVKDLTKQVEIANKLWSKPLAPVE